MDERNIVEIVRENVVRYMAEAGMKKFDLAMAVGGAAVIQRLIDGGSVNGPTIVTLQKIAMALG
ncbi:helix-turn-helix domain-containing protein, partial [Bacillus velezensis]|uniref:helix-turn-helix domain-containing protein n=1 Tax=Bacillus velezensis TaxID=492670 RepID=UPI0012B0C511